MRFLYHGHTNGQTYSSSGTYMDTLVNTTGCDSIVTLNLTINNSTTNTTSADICNGDSFHFGTQTLTSSGTYIEVFSASNGCDSTVTLNLNVLVLDTSVSVNNNTLAANGLASSYQWIDCNNNAPIVGATNVIFTPTQTGNYAVILTQNNCSDTSGCYNVVIIGLRNAFSESIILYPNPTKDKLFIDYPESLEIKQIRIITVAGAELIRTNTSKLSDGINTSSLNAGTYQLILEGVDFRKELKFVKE